MSPDKMSPKNPMTDELPPALQLMASTGSISDQIEVKPTILPPLETQQKRQ